MARGKISKGNGILDAYQEAHEAVYEYFGYTEGYVALPFDDARDYYWMLVHDSTVYFAETKEEVNDDNATYSNEVLTSRHIENPIVRKKDLTMIAVDTNTDGNKFLQIFDNAKELKYDPDNED